LMQNRTPTQAAGEYISLKFQQGGKKTSQQFTPINIKCSLYTS
jgi:hypothetical protein